MHQVQPDAFSPSRVLQPFESQPFFSFLSLSFDHRLVLVTFGKMPCVLYGDIQKLIVRLLRRKVVYNALQISPSLILPCDSHSDSDCHPYARVSVYLKKHDGSALL